MLTLHALILALNIAPALLSMRSFRYINNCESRYLIKPVVIIVLIVVIVKSLWFVVMQSLWIIDGYDEKVGLNVSFGWMMFDFWNGFANIAIAYLIHIKLKWRCVEPCRPD